MPTAARTAPLLGLAAALAVACAPGAPALAPAPAETSAARLEREIREIVGRLAPDTVEVSVALADLATGDSVLVDARTRMHAASTMKVPVMVQLFRLADAGELRIDDQLRLENRFRSIADGSAYSLSPSDDSDSALYAQVGQGVPIRELIGRMIYRSSNLATNALIALAEPARIATTLGGFGAGEMHVLRGVEDNVAFRAGMNNTTTAYALMKVMEAIARGRAASPASTAEMLAILERQEFTRMIPAGLPAGTRVANKTGWITGIDHDAAIVLPTGREPYVLVILTRGFRDGAASRAVGQAISAHVHGRLVGGR